MRPILCACVVALACLCTPARADSRSDAEYIVNQTLTRAHFEGVFAAARPMMIAALQHDFREKGISLPDPDRFFDLFMAEFMDEFVQSMRAQTASVYLENFSEQEIADIAAFYKTDAGQAMIRAAPALMMEGAKMGREAGQRAGENAGKRLAARIRAEGLIQVDDPGLLSKLLDALR